MAFQPNSEAVAMEEALLEGAVINVGALLTKFASSDHFHSILETSFGDNSDTRLIEELQQALYTGAFFDGIEIEVLPSAELEGALGAYAEATNTIYLSQDLLVSSTQQASAVLLEEVGHAIDAYLNVEDSAGDEGAIFSALVRDVSLSPLEWQQLKAEDDTATLTINGEAVTVEQADVSYIGGDGDWYDPANWSNGTVPGTNDDVTITSNNTDITITFSQGNPSVNSLSLFAENGGNLALSGLTSYEGADFDTSIRATGGSSIDLSSITTLSGGTGYKDQLFIEAINGTVNLSNLTDITGGATRVLADGTNSNIDLSSLNRFADDNGYTYSQVNALNGGTIQTPNLDSLNGVSLLFNSSGNFDAEQITSVTNGSITVEGTAANLSSLTNVSGSSVTLSNGGTADFSNVSNIDTASLFVNDGVSLELPQVTSYEGTNFDTSIRATGGSNIDLSSITTLSGGTEYKDELFIEAINGTINLSNLTDITGGATRVLADGTNSNIDLSSLNRFADDNGYTYSQVNALNGGTIQTPNLDSLNGVSLLFNSSGNFDAEQITSVTNGSITVEGTAANLSSLTNVSGSSVTLSNGGTADFSNVSNIDTASLFVNDGVSLELPQVTSYEGTNSDTSIQATGGSSIDLSSITTLSGGTGYKDQLFIEAINGTVNLSNLTDITGGATRVLADGTNSNIDLSSLNRFADDNGYTYSQVNALNGGTIDLDQLSDISGEVLPITADGTNSIIDLFQISESNSSINPTEENGGDIIFLENEVPTFTSPDAIEISENETDVVTLSATDPDGDTLSFSITGGVDEDLFTLDDEGGLSFSNAPDFENPSDEDGNNVYQVTVTVDDGKDITVEQDLTVTVTDVNEAPTFTSENAIEISENETDVVTLSATDPDGDTLSFSITGGVDEDLFTLDDEGSLSFSNAPDFENPSDEDGNNVYQVTVTVADGKGSTVEQDLTVTVTDVNEAPTFTSENAIEISENETDVVTLTATDPDGDTLSFSITGGVDEDLFTLDEGSLSFSNAPDFENPSDEDGNNVYQVTVTVADGKGSTVEQDLTVTVTDVNEAPTFTSENAIEISENETDVVTLSATDPDGDTLSFSITGGADEGLFTLDDEGSLSFSNAPDFETPSDEDGNNVYQVTVTVADGKGSTVEQDLTVTVTDVNEAPIIEDQSFSIPENSEGETVVGAIEASDPEGNSLSYSLEEEGFGINETGEIFVTGETDLDFETNPNRELTVTVSDGEFTPTATVTVNLTDVNEAPTFTSENAIEVSENETSVVTLSATDPDGDTLSFSITGGADAALFTLDEDENLTFNQSPDFENPQDSNSDNIYQVQVSADDGNGGNSSQSINLEVLDVNESPEITSDSLPTIEENTIAPLSLQADDPDGDEVTFSLTGGADQGLFTINPDTGELEFNNPPDFENPIDADEDNIYVLEVTATDSEGANVSETLEVIVENVNEVPTAEDDTGSTDEDSSFTVDAANGVLANDVDPDGDALTVRAVNGEAGKVDTEITLDSGALLTLNADGSYEYDTNGAFEDLNDGETATDTFTYTVADGNGGTATAEIRITINGSTGNQAPVVEIPINDINLSQGEIPDPINLFDLFEDNEDTDEELTYSITEQTNADLIQAAINEGEGELSFVIFSGSGSSNITIQATDTDGLSVSETFTVTVNARNTAPEITNPLNDLSIDAGSDPVPINLFETFEDTQDADSDLKFRASSSNKSLVNADSINTSSGELFLQFPSTRTGSSEITVSAVDTSGFTTTETFTVTVNPSGEVISLEETNDTLETASTPQLSPDTPNINLAGEIGDNNFGDQDIDLYRLELQKGDQLTADINTDDNSSLDSFLRLFDSFGQEVERNDDSQQGENDSLLEFSADTSQTYYIGVSGFGNDQYNPNLENSGSKGDTGSYNLALTLTSTASETPNDTISQAIATSALIQENGQFQQPGFLGDNSTLNNPNLDVDFYEIQLTQGETATIDIDTTENSPLNPILRIFNATGGNVPNGFNDNAKAPGEQLGNDPYLEFSAPFSGTYYVGVSDQANDLYSPYNPESGQSPGATGAYEINITQDVSREDSPPEASPNDTLDTATALLVGDEIQGNIGDRTEFVTVPGLDVDLYTLTLEADQAIRINLNRTSRLDPVLRLFNAQGEEIAFNDDIGSSDNALLELTIPETGDYYIGVSGFGNENYDVTTAGSGKSFASTGSYQLIISDQQPEILEAGEEEENDTLDTATATSLTADSLGSLKQTNAIGNNPNLEEAGLDVDIFQVELDTNTRLTAEINTENFNSEFDSLLRVFNSEGEQLDFNDDESSENLDSQLEFIPTAPGTYYVGVSGLGNENYNPNTVSSGNAGSIGDYEIELRLNEVTPQENPTNETPETASQVNLTNNRFSTNGVIGDNTNVEVDRDFYEIDLEQGNILNIRVNGDNLESFVRLFNSKDEEIPLEYEAGDFPHPSLNLTIPEDDTYFLQISAFDNNEDGIPDDSIGDYRLNLAVAPPPLAAQPPVEEIRPTANNDRFRAASQRTAIFNVLGNDSANDDQGFLEITDFTATTEKGGTVELDNQSRLRYTPNPDFGGVDTFTYTVANESGGFDQGTVEVNVNRPPEGASVQVELDVRSVPGKEDQLNDGLQIGEEFIVDVRFLDRTAANNPSQAVLSGYADLLFNPEILQVISEEEIDTDGIINGVIHDNSRYNLLRKGTVRNEEGLVNEAGAGTLALGGVESLPEDNRIFSLHFQAVGGGNTALLASQAGQQINSAITILNPDFISDQRDQTRFGEVDIISALNNQNNIESAFPPSANFALSNNIILSEQEDVSAVQGVIEAMAVNIDFQDLAGNALEDVAVGEEFKIVLSAEDLRPEGQQLGVFSVFADVLYDTVLIDVTEAELVGDFASPVLELPTAVEQGSGEGLIDELGGTQSNFNPVRSGSQTFAELTVTAKAPGQLDVSTNAPEGKTAKNTLFGVDVEVTEGTVYSEKSINLVGETEEGNPDLVITEFDAVVDHVLGGETEVNLTVENQGDGSSPGFQVEILYYTADDPGELEEEEPMVVKTLAFEELTGSGSRSETAAVSLPVEVMLAEALEDDPSVFGETVPEEGFFESNNIDYLGVRLVNSESSGETTEEFTNNGVDGTEGVNVDDIAYFPWDVVRNDLGNVVQGGEDEVETDGAVSGSDLTQVYDNIGTIISEGTGEAPSGLDLGRIDLDLDGAISPVDAVRVANRLGYNLNPAIIEESVG
ncbi:Ig-like domain-containing protein [Dactylococcopsis salina]|uniref:Cadherin domain-containing protein,putative pre-peptidase n=1 Tax=Dactylococcopsis salina (strain PCC 8305) TaxID=13035 RepID=K9YRT7_DACS8|nr:Ig-like domain-containing protein [Dactylococcopsis salina]AFZ49599.1 Cadherin domain-containing protein,putative pre-peptidase [Dactylococcopsis salina PCC 8305]